MMMVFKWWRSPLVYRGVIDIPTSERQRKAVYAELNRRMAGKAPKMFVGMSSPELQKYAHEPLHKKKKKKGY